LNFDRVVWVGAEKIKQLKGRNFLTVSTDLIATRVRIASAKKNAASWEAFGAEFMHHNGRPKAIKCLAID
jgi:hypothetical protein